MSMQLLLNEFSDSVQKLVCWCNVNLHLAVFFVALYIDEFVADKETNSNFSKAWSVIDAVGIHDHQGECLIVEFLEILWLFIHTFCNSFHADGFPFIFLLPKLEESCCHFFSFCFAKRILENILGELYVLRAEVHRNFGF